MRQPAATACGWPEPLALLAVDGSQAADQEASELAAWRAGRAEGFAAVYDRYLPRVREIVRLRMGTHLRAAQDSLDVVQDVFARLFDAPPPPEVEGDGALCSYLASAVEHRLCDLGRHAHRAKRDVRRELRGGLASEELTRLAAGVATPSEVLMGKELYERYLATVAALQEREREAIIAARHLGLDAEECARRLGSSSPGAFRVLLSRALAKVTLALRPSS